MRKLVSILTGLLMVIMAAFFPVAAGVGNGSTTVQAELDRVRVSIGDVIEFRIIAESADKVRFHFPDENLDLSPFTILDRRIAIPETGRDVTHETLILTLSIYETGEFKIPPVTVQWENVDGKKGEVKTESQFVQVQSVLTGEETQFRNLKGPF
ncbi:hypothetical protein K8T06_17155, partial [bacterium]|nr:hypothetical protein [bacterium]